MEYRIAGSYREKDDEPSFETRDGVVSATSPSYRWALGKKLGEVLSWARVKWLMIHVREGAAQKWKRVEL